MSVIKVQCCRCKNKDMESERLKVPTKKYGSGVSDMICPRCRCTTYYRLQAKQPPSAATCGVDIRDGRLAVQQGKTKAKRRIEITGELKIVLDRIMARKDSHQFRSTRLIVLEDGTPLTVAMLRRRFDLAREAAGVKKADFQMRDLRAKAGMEKFEASGDILQARDQLGHTTVVMTEHYIRNRIGKKVSPTK